MTIKKNSNKQAFLLLSQSTSKEVIKDYDDIKKGTKQIGDAFILFHQQDQQMPDELRNINHFIFTDDILHELNYLPIKNSILPGSNHFPLLKFYLENPGYSHYWIIEDDVKFSGKWEHFFTSFAFSGYDFISSYIRTVVKEGYMPWCNTLSHPIKYIADNDRLKSSNQIYCISAKALQFIHESLIDKWQGHHEVLFPTLLHHAGFKLLDFGGSGEFVLPGFENKYNDRSTFDFRPIYDKCGDKKDKLYHPVKHAYTQKTFLKITYCIVYCSGLSGLNIAALKASIEEISYPDYEILILDSHFSKKTETDFLKAMRKFIESGIVKYYKNYDHNTANAKTQAFKLATGQVVFIANGDYYLGRDFFHHVNSLFNKQRKLFVTITYFTDDSWRYNKMGKYYLIGIKKDDFAATTGFDKHLAEFGYEDFDLAHRLLASGITQVELSVKEFLRAPEYKLVYASFFDRLLQSVYVEYINEATTWAVFLFSDKSFKAITIRNKQLSHANNLANSYRLNSHYENYSNVHENSAGTFEEKNDGITFNIDGNSLIFGYSDKSIGRKILNGQSGYKTLYEVTDTHLVYKLINAKLVTE